MQRSMDISSSSSRLGSLLLLLLAPLLAADLIQVQVVARAGARKWVPYNKPKRETGSGLLPSGYVGMEQMGKVLKARYFGKAADVPLTNVTDVYKNGDALIRTISRDQTVSSADALAYGIWSPVAAAGKAAPLTGGYQSVPVFTISRGVDYLLSAYTACPAIQSNVETFLNSTEYQKKEQATADIRTKLGTLLNMSPELADMPFMYDRVILATQYGDVPSGGELLPAVTAAQIAALADMANFVEHGKYANPDTGVLCGGPLLSEIFDRIGAVVGNVGLRAAAFLAYVGTHPTLNCLLSALNSSDPTVANKVHPYGSAVIFETHKVGAEYYLNTLYLEGGTTEFKNVFLNKKADAPCGSGGQLCTLDNARDLMADRMEPSLIDWCDACSSYFMPACNQALQVKMSDALDIGHSNKASAHRHRLDTVGAAFIGLFMGAFLVVLFSFLGPKLKRRWSERGSGAGYVSGGEGGMEGGIEAQGRRSGREDEGTVI